MVRRPGGALHPVTRFRHFGNGSAIQRRSGIPRLPKRANPPLSTGTALTGCKVSIFCGTNTKTNNTTRRRALMPKRALILIDIQNDYFPGGKRTLSGVDAATDNAAKVLAAARKAGATWSFYVHTSSHRPTRCSSLRDRQRRSTRRREPRR